jgi:DNA-binding transcriptional MerR regulator
VKIGQLASQAGVSIDTVRYYERRGVLPAAPRTASGYRLYTEAAVARIRLARRLQSLGLTLDEIIGALHAQDVGDTAGTPGPRELCASERWRLREALDRIESRLADLVRARDEVRDALDACEAGTCDVLAL